MYCKNAGRECGYLEQVERLRQDALLAKATATDVSREHDAELIEKESDSYFEGELHCNDNFCVALGQTVRNSLVQSALNRKS